MTPGSEVWTLGNSANNHLETEYCSGDYYCQINWDSRESIHNLIVQLNFECAPKWKLGLIGSVFLAGIVIGCSSVTKLGDIYGRRPIYLMGLTLNFVLVGMLIVLRNVLVVYFCLFFLGISIAARYYVGYTYNLEFQPKRSHVIVSVVQFSAESIVYLLNIAYFVYISDRWIPLQIPNLILSLVGVIYVYFMPETPVWLVATKKYDSARGVFA